MSTDPRASHSDPQQAQEKEKLAYGTILGVAAISLLIFAVGGFWAVGILRATEREVLPDGPKPVPAQAGQIEIGLVNMALFAQDRRADERVAEQQKRLVSFGYADPEKQTLHIPIEEAIKQALRASAQDSGKSNGGSRFEQ